MHTGYTIQNADQEKCLHLGDEQWKSISDGSSGKIFKYIKAVVAKSLVANIFRKEACIFLNAKGIKGYAKKVGIEY